MSSHRKLPDDALTVFERAGLGGLGARVEQGLLEPGTYECPWCGGTGIDPESPVREMDRCVGCDGDGVLVFLEKQSRAAGVVVRGFGAAWREHRRIELLKWRP